MNTQRISAITLDESTILWRNPNVEQERRVAMRDLIEENSFAPVRAMAKGHAGPWALHLSIRGGSLAMGLRDANGEEADTILLGLARFRRTVREYFAICDSYYKAIRRASTQEIETIDMARRAIHDRATRHLVEALENSVRTDFETARRLFTLICVLHIKG